MTTYTPPARDMAFLLNEVLEAPGADIPGYEEMSPDFTAAVLEEAGKLARDVLAPLNRTGDREGCRLENGAVHTPTGFRAAFEQMRQGGWTGLDCDPEYGGQGMPYLLGTAVGEMWVSSNMAFNMYQGLTHAAYSTIRAHGSEQQKATYLPKMVSCEWTGTMNLTEPHCGTDLGLLRTKAEPQGDGTYRITGTKIFISAGDNDLAENVIHLVLARITGAPAGTKGISLFIVPKYRIDADGKPGEANGVSVGALEEKMGIHGSATCVMNFDGAVGTLLGEENKGLKAMFTMMNEARIGVGLQGYALAEAAYQAARAYALERLQGRAVTGPVNPDGPADPLIVHPDVRRALMDQKSFVEGARALTFWGAQLIDRATRTGDQEAHGLISLLTPVIKGFQTDKGFESCVQAQQIFGGHGYIEEHPMSQYVRDARITMIYEGANGVQALDLVGRKLAADGGKPMMGFFERVKGFIKAHEDDPALKESLLDPLKSASKDLQAAVMFFMENGMKNPNAALAGSTDFLHLFGHVALGYMWARMGAKASAALAAGASDAAFYETKLATARYYAARQLPATRMHLARILSGAEPVMALAPEEF